MIFIIEEVVTLEVSVIGWKYHQSDAKVAQVENIYKKLLQVEKRVTSPIMKPAFCATSNKPDLP